jgi:hypothetical protein
MGPWKVTDTVPAAVEHTMWTQASGGDLSRNFVAGSVTTFSDAAATLQSDVDSKAARQMERSSSLIVSALGDATLRIVADADDDPAKMLSLLGAHYASSRAMSRILSQTALYSKTCNNGDFSMFVDELASQVPQLERMGYDASVPESHKATILLASIPSSRRWRRLPPRCEQRTCRS